MPRVLALLAVALSGCFGPDYPVGLACTERGQCPGDQVCVDAVCVLRSSVDPADASPFAIDAGDGDAVDSGFVIVPDGAPCVAVDTDDDTCDAIDDDCDGTFDENTGSGGIWYQDLDGDGYGAVEVSACVQPEGTVAASGDCWDSAEWPAAFHANPSQNTPQSGLMVDSTTELGDWNCDGSVVYETYWCSPGCSDVRCSYVDYSGWDSVFAECGATETYCTYWDPYKDYCPTTEPKLQRCL